MPVAPFARPEPKCVCRPLEKIVETPRCQGFGLSDEIGNYVKAADGETGVIRMPVRFLILNDDLSRWVRRLSCSASLVGYSQPVAVREYFLLRLYQLSFSKTRSPHFGCQLSSLSMPEAIRASCLRHSAEHRGA
jgi:hypothetical protein